MIGLSAGAVPPLRRLSRAVFHMLHRGLGAIGRSIAVLAILALVAMLFFVPIMAVLLASILAAGTVENVTGGGGFVLGLMVCGVMGLIGWYVSPHVQPQIGEAIKVLLTATRE